MVSRLLSSLSEMLSSSPRAPIENEEGIDDMKNDNEQRQSVVDVYGKKSHQQTMEKNHNNCSFTKSNFDLQFVNAESLDRAIVNRLHSRMSTSIADALESRNSVNRVKSRCETDSQRSSTDSPPSEENEIESNSNLGEVPIVDITSGQLDTKLKSSSSGTAAVTGGIYRPQSSPLIKPSLSQSSVISQDIPPVRAKTTHTFKSLIDDLDSGMATPTKYMTANDLPPGERRSVMYRNSQFNLENASKEALCSTSSSNRVFTDDVLNLPMFGIPDPSLHRRPSLTSSTESIRGSESRSFTNNTTYTAKRRSRSASPAPLSRVTPRISATQIGDHFFESTINDIIEKGGDEFKIKYSSWIWDAFRSQLVKIKSLMISEFNEKLKDALDEREREASEIQKRYRQKLVEFDVTTDNFQKLMDNMYKENQRVITAKDFVIDKLKKEFLECKKHFEQDLQRQMDGYRKEAEVERMELQKRNDELMMIMLTDASKCGLEEAFKNEIETLQKMIKTLTSQNEELHQQLEEATSSVGTFNRCTVENLEVQIERATEEIMDLRKKLQYTESEKEDLRVSYHQEIAKLNRKIQESNTRYDHQLRDAAEELENVRRKYGKDIKDFKQKLANQEAQHNSILNQVRQQYGSQVETLSQAVSQLRSELTGNGPGTRSSH